MLISRDKSANYLIFKTYPLKPHKSDLDFSKKCPWKNGIFLPKNGEGVIKSGEGVCFAREGVNFVKNLAKRFLPTTKFSCFT